MIRRKRNPGVAYAGRVGARLRPPLIRRTIAPPKKSACYCADGPWRGHHLWLSEGSDWATLPIVIRGESGRYVGGRWVLLQR